jgi:hypothetical protein
MTRQKSEVRGQKSEVSPTGATGFASASPLAASDVMPKHGQARGTRVMALVLVLATASTLFAVEADNIRRKQQAQEKARLLATELVANVLDIQLTQLEENGLTKLPIFGDIKSMRGNVDVMVEKDMQGIIDSLVKVQELPAAERTKRFSEVRTQVREVVVKLMAERQKLYRRMQIQKIALQQEGNGQKRQNQ